MKDYVAYIIGEWKRYIYRGSLAAWLIILVLMIYQVNSSVQDIKPSLKKIEVFKRIQKIYFEYMTDYDKYKFIGFKILLIPSLTGLITNNSTNQIELKAEVVSPHIKISNNWKGKAVFRQGQSIKLDNFGVIKWLMPLLALWFAFGAFLNRKFIKSLSSIWARLLCYLNIVMARLLLFIVFFLAMMGIVILFMLARGVTFTPGDWSVTFSFLLGSIAYLMVFFGVGAIIGILGYRKLSYILLFTAWFVFIFGAEWLTGLVVEQAFPDAIEDYQTELNKFSDIINFEKKAEQEHGKFDRKNIEQGRLVIEDYWKNYYLAIILPKERDFRNKLAAAIEKDRSWSQWFPGTFFDRMSNEVSGHGYNNYLLFYDYTIEKHSQFVRFLIDRTYYNDPKIMVNFIKGNEDVFIGKSSLPPNYWTGVLIHLGYFVVLLIVGYFCFAAKLFPKPRNAREFDQLVIDVKSGENITIQDYTEGDTLRTQLVNAFFGKSRHLPLTLTLDGKPFPTGKNPGFLFVPKPGDIPGEFKGKHLVRFFKRVFKLPGQDITQLEKEIGNETLNKHFCKMKNEERFKLVLSLFFLVKSPIYLCDSFAEGITGDLSSKLEDFVEKKLPAGSMIIEITVSGKKWNDQLHWYAAHLKEGKYRLLKPKN